MERGLIYTFGILKMCFELRLISQSRLKDHMRSQVERGRISLAVLTV